MKAHERIKATKILAAIFPVKVWGRDEERKCLVCGKKENYFSDLCGSCTMWLKPFGEKSAVKRLDYELSLPCYFDFQKGMPGSELHRCKNLIRINHNKAKCRENKTCKNCNSLLCRCTC